MKRKSFAYTIGERKLLFFERDKEYIDVDGVSERYKAHNFEFIQKNTTDKEDRLALLSLEMKRSYTPMELGLFSITNLSEIKRGLYYSYSLNPELNGALLTFDEFEKIIENDYTEIESLLKELEKPREVKKKVTA